MGRLVFFGIDGLDYFLWKSLMDRGVMPFSKTLMQKGTLVPMDSSYPEVSSAAWASIITGKNPGGHNIFGFTDLIPGTYTLGFTSSKTCKAKPFWQEDSSRKSLIINIPQTYPAQPLHGILVSGFVSIDLAKGVYPLEELPVFQNAGYQFDVDSSLAAESKVLFYEGLFDVLRKRESILHHYWEEQAWDTIFFVVTGTDRLNHHGWWDFEDTASPFHQDYLNFYTEVDRVLSRVVDRLHPDDSLVILSDHGFERQDYSLNVNRFLQDHGFLHLRDEKYMNHNCILPGTKALAMDPGRIYFHREGRFPAGSVREDDVDSLRDELCHLFHEWTIDGKKVVNEIRRGEDLYSGLYASRGPDLVLMTHAHISLSGRIQTSDLVEDTQLSGKHTFHNAVFYYAGPGKLSLKDPFRVEQIIPMLQSMDVLPSIQIKD
jgi:predicted AlkP superfamily phosphohydrolase/phosphomutase